MDNVKKETYKKDFVNKTIDFLFSNDERKWLVFILILGATLRLIVARNINAIADEMVHGPHAIGFLHSGLISTIAHSPLWFYLTDIFFKILGVTLFSTRFLSFFYGVLSIIVVYFIASRIFNKKAGLVSAFLLSVSFYLIRYTLAEMDLSAIFFLVTAVYFFIDSLENNKFPWLAAVCIGLAALIKTLSLFFVPAFLIGFFLFNQNKERNVKKNLKNMVYFGLIVLLFFSPILVHNYLWYKDKGMVDTYFAQYFNIGNARQAYSGQLGFDSGFLMSIFFKAMWDMSKFIFNTDPIIVILGLLGIIFAFNEKEKRNYVYFLLSFQLFGYILLLLSNHLPTHYTTMVPVLCIFSGFFIDRLAQKIKSLDYKKTISLAIILILVVQLVLLWPHLSSRSGLSKMREYAMEKMDKNSIVVADSRIYRGRITWMFNDFHYLESSYFPTILSLNNNLTGQNTNVKVYFIECVPDDCGWGTIKSQPEFNASTEQMFDYVKQNSKKLETVYGGGGYDDATGAPYFVVYEANAAFKPQVFNLVDSTHDWFYYPLNYLPKEKIFDTYEVVGPLDNVIYKFAWLVIIVSIILALLMPLKVIRDLIKMK